MFRELNYEDLSQASDVLWKSFYFAEKNNHSLAGMERFRDLTSPVSLSINTYEGKLLLFGAFEGDAMVAVGAVKEEKHILLLYVHPEWQKKGIGAAFLAYMENRCKSKTITLNSSDGAIGFYLSQGYTICGARTVEEELIYTPMKKKTK